MDNLDDLLVRVQRKGAAGPDRHRYTVEMWIEGGRRLSEREEISLDDYREPLTTDPREIANHGLDLFNRLFVGKLATAFHQTWAAAGARRRQVRLRLALDPQAPALHAIPWELMHFDDSGGVSPPRPISADQRIVFSRYIESAEFDEGRPVEHRPVRMLLVISAPNNLTRWGLAEVDKAAEERDLRTRFSPIINSGQFACDSLAVASEEALHDALAQGSPEGQRPIGYDVLLYYGHALHQSAEGSRLVLEHPETGGARLYDGDEFVAFLQKLPETHRPAMVALVACNSATTAGEVSINSLAADLVITAGIPAVLAMQRLVEIALARSFTYHLSESLLRDGLIDVAVNTARIRVFQPDSVSWTTPVLYMRYAEGRLFTPNAQLEYVEAVLRNPDLVRWRGPDFINLGVLTIAPGQDWNLLRARPEDAPAAVGVLEALRRALRLEEERRERKTARSDSNLVALIGPPHSGQSTVLERFCYDLAGAVTRDPAQPPGVLISLAGYELQRGAGRLERHIIEGARAVTPSLANTLSDLFRPPPNPPSAQRPRFIFLLDSLEAIPERARLDAARDLDSLAERYSDQLFVITSAQDSYPSHLLPTAQVLVLQPLNERQIFDYLRGRNEAQAFQIMRQIRDNRLLALAGDPSLLSLIFSRLVDDPLARLTRNQLVQEYLDRALSNLDPRFSIGDAARESLTELAWYGRWTHQELLPLGDLFRTLARVRRERDYSLEDLYTLLCDSRLLMGVGQHAARFVNPALHTYCAAIALIGRPDFRDRLADIITLCTSPERLGWWEEVLYALAGLMNNPTPLFANLADSIRAGGHTHALVAARCLEALPPDQEGKVPVELRNELIDACVLRLRADREPIAERREQIATALGRLSYLQVRHELRRILVEKVRPSSSGPRYEYTNVRIAAARALRNIYMPSFVQLPAAQAQQQAGRPARSLVLTDHSDQASLSAAPQSATLTMPSMDQIREDQMLVRLIRVWVKGTAGRDEFRDLLRNSPNPPERAIAAFALGDLPDVESRKLLDARQLLRIILSPTEDSAEPISEDWADTMWAAADALTLFEPDQVIPLLTVLVTRAKEIPDSAAQQLAYLAGRVRASSPEVIDWLIGLVVSNPSQTVKSKALQSLAWMGLGIPDRRIQLPDARPGPTLKQLIHDIAAWRPIRGLPPDTFALAMRRSDSDGTPLYLRRKAIEALAWIGDAETLRDMGAVFLSWPLELREYWYQAAATIRRRIGR